jgi:hypothetical protein
MRKKERSSLQAFRFDSGRIDNFYHRGHQGTHRKSVKVSVLPQARAPTSKIFLGQKRLRSTGLYGNGAHVKKKRHHAEHSGHFVFMSLNVFKRFFCHLALAAIAEFVGSF